MAHLTCPRCGSAAHVRLTPPAHVRCVACAYAGPPLPGDAAVLEEVVGVLAAAQHHVDELSAEQRSFLTNGRASLSLSYGLAFGFLSYNGLSAIGFVRAWIDHGPSVESVAAVALLIVVSFGVIAFFVWRFGRRIHDAEARFGASPPLVDGAPPACRLCGGDLAASTLTTRVLVACRYCRAQNLLVPGALRARVARVVADAHAIRRKILSGEGTRRWHERFLVARLVIALGANMATGALIWSGTAHTLPRKLAFFHNSYPRACVSRWSARSLGAHVAVLRPSGVTHHTVNEGPMAASGTSYRYFTADTLVGRTVEVMHERPWTGHVVGARGDSLILQASGRAVEVPAHAVCVARLEAGEDALKIVSLARLR